MPSSSPLSAFNCYCLTLGEERQQKSPWRAVYVTSYQYVFIKIGEWRRVEALKNAACCGRPWLASASCPVAGDVLVTPYGMAQSVTELHRGYFARPRADVWFLVAKCARAVHDPVARSVAVLDQLLPPPSPPPPDNEQQFADNRQGVVIQYDRDRQGIAAIQFCILF